MRFLDFGKRPIKLVSAGLFVIFVLFLCLNAFNIKPFDDQMVVQTYKPNKLLEEVRYHLNTYDIQVDLDPDGKEIMCVQELEYTNNTQDSHDRLYFHIYPNAFKHERKVPFPPEDMKQAYPNGFSPGNIDIIEVRSDDMLLEYFIKGYSEEILEVHLPKDILPGEGIELSMTFKVTIPNCLGRFGYGNYTFNITNWYPILCVYGKQGWHTYPYFPIGDPFYSDVANYNVKISTPKDYNIACTGNISSVTERGDKKLWDIEAVAVRDFAFIASDRFMVDSKKIGHTTVYSYYFTPKTGKKALKYASDSIKIFNKYFGKYPYNQFSVVEADFYIGGMEYPNLVLIDQTLYTTDQDDFLEIVTVHETAHQWWYGVVGNNQIEEAWLDEGLTEYSTLLYFKHRYGQKKMDKMKESFMANGKYSALPIYVQGKEIDETIARPVYRFPDWIVYDILVYGKGAMLFDSLYSKVGENNFYKILNEYYEDNMFKNATLTDLLYACEKVTGEDYAEFFDDWLYDE